MTELDLRVWVYRQQFELIVVFLWLLYRAKLPADLTAAMLRSLELQALGQVLTVSQNLTRHLDPHR
jgi:hypothetical protein